MRTPPRVTFALWVTLLTFALCILGIREELHRAYSPSGGYPLAGRQNINPTH